MSWEKGVLVAACLFFVGCSSKVSFPDGQWLDLTHDFSAETIYWPTEAGFQFQKGFAGYTEAGFYYEANSFASAEHGGTHLDSPVHFAKDRWTVEQIPIDKFVGPAVVIDVSQKALANPDYQVSVEDFQAWESEHHQIPHGAIVLLRTGYGQFWPDRVKYMGTGERGAAAVAKLHFPGLDPQAARWLVENRSIDAVGLDTPSIDYGQSKLFETHQTLFQKNVPAFENVANLDQLPVTGAQIFAFPMKIQGGSGAPLRVVAFLPR